MFGDADISKIRRDQLKARTAPIHRAISDNEGHYDIDGVSTAFDHVVVAGDERETLPKNSLGTLKEIEKQADQTSLELEDQKTPEDDGQVDKNHQQIYSANYHSEYKDYLDVEQAGD